MTQRRHLKYLFTVKHHGGDREAAQWLESLTLTEEFSVFDLADFLDLSDERGWLYGVLREGGLRFLGTWNQQIAVFPSNDERQPWHGYPLYPLNGLGPENRRGEKCKPSKEVFEKMVVEGVLAPRERKRLSKGDYA